MCCSVKAESEISSSGLENFQQVVQTFHALLADKKIRTVSRGEKNLPKLNYTVKGNYVYIQNYQSYLNYCNRKLPQLIKFFTLKLGCAIEHTDKHLRIRGNLKIELIKFTERQFYLKEILCVYCGSPETERIDNQIFCSNCSQTKS